MSETEALSTENNGEKIKEEKDVDANASSSTSIPPCSPIVLSNLCEALKDNAAFYDAVMKLGDQLGFEWVRTKKAPSVVGAVYVSTCAPDAVESANANLVHKRPRMAEHLNKGYSTGMQQQPVSRQHF